MVANTGWVAMGTVVAIGLVAACAPSPASSDQTGTSVPTPQVQRYERRAKHDPDGTGIFYMGREIAHYMSHEAASWLDRPERDAEEAPRRLLDTLKLRPGMVVADVGAGSGYLSFPIARRVGNKGKVLAVDIQPEMLEIIRRKAKESGVGNVETILGASDDPKVPAGTADLILLVDVYHELDKPYEMTQNMIRGLKPGGRLVLVEYRAEDPFVPIKPLHKMTEAQVRREMAQFPLRWKETVRSLPRQHVLIFEKL